jgi:hypothetical protein
MRQSAEAIAAGPSCTTARTNTTSHWAPRLSLCQSYGCCREMRISGLNRCWFHLRDWWRLVRRMLDWSPCIISVVDLLSGAQSRQLTASCTSLLARWRCTAVDGRCCAAWSRCRTLVRGCITPVRVGPICLTAVHYPSPRGGPQVTGCGVRCLTHTDAWPLGRTAVGRAIRESMATRTSAPCPRSRAAKTSPMRLDARRAQLGCAVAGTAWGTWALWWPPPPSLRARLVAGSYSEYIPWRWP